MELLSHPLVAFFILLGLLVFVHEAGHFIVGRLSGIAVEIFSIGFGPPIVRFKVDQTDYRISWIPLGGYVKFYGMSAAENVPSNIKGCEFRHAPLLGRSLTLAAGPFANLVLAFVVYTVLGMSGIPHARSVVDGVTPDSPAQRAGLEFQDEIIAIDDQPVKTWREMRTIIAASPGKKLMVKVKRDQQILTLPVTPDAVKQPNIKGEMVEVGRVGIALGALPPVISIADRASVAAAAGMQTGHVIEAIQVKGEWQEIKYWEEFLRIFNEDVRPEASALVLRVKMAEELLAGQVPESKEVTVPLTSVSEKDGGHRYSDATVRALGLRDAQLTFGRIAEEFKNMLKPGDQVISWDGEPINDFFALYERQLENKKPRVNVDVLRNFEVRSFNLPLIERELQKPSGREVVYQLPLGMLGDRIRPEPWIEKYDSIVGAVWFGLKETAIQTTFLAATVGRLISGDVPMKALGGPMLIAKVASDSAKAGWKAFVSTMALISVNLAVLNMVPIPLLDGGQLVICGIEAIRRRRLSEVAIENYQKIGFAMIMALVVLATYNDLSRFWTSMLESVAGFFQ